jgi:radical SAM protein with 4Fe4S-binding SPASM domain
MMYSRLNRLRDFIALVHSLNLRRLCNLVKIGMGYLAFLVFRITRHPGLPVSASIEPTTACNLRCPECPTGSGNLLRAKGMMSIQSFNKVIDQLSSHIIYLTLYFQGEPFLNPDFFKMIISARSRRIYVATSTNGHYLDAATAEATVLSGLNRLIISIDGTDQETYSAYRRGGNLDKVKEGVRLVSEFRKKHGVWHPYLIIQFLVLSTNENQKEEVKKMGFELGADEVQFKSAQFIDYKRGNPLMPLDKKFNRYKSIGGNFIPVSGIPKRCFRMWSSTVITWDGIVVPCCFDKNAAHQTGSLVDNDFKEIWNSKQSGRFRANIRNSRDSVDICCNCNQYW